MQVSVTVEGRFDSTPDGRVWTGSQFDQEYWARYLTTFDSVRVIARVRLVADVPSQSKQVNGPQIDVYPLPYYVGFGQFLRVVPRLTKILWHAADTQDAVIMRIPSPIAGLIEPKFSRRGRPFALEVVGDPYDVFAAGSIRHFLRPIFRRWSTNSQKRQCRNAAAITYVTSHKLQQRYPPGSKVSFYLKPGESQCAEIFIAPFVTNYSSVELPPERFLPKPIARFPRSHPPLLVTIGTLETPYKAVDVLLRALAMCVAKGVSARLSILGDGIYRGEMERLAADLGLGTLVTFRGQVPKEAVFQELDQADLFVLPSRTEGLPRAMIEAMARGLPCIGTSVGGIPELLPAEYLVPPDDAERLASEIMAVINNPVEMSRMSAHNLSVAHEYSEIRLAERRDEFYRYIRKITDVWRGSEGDFPDVSFQM